MIIIINASWASNQDIRMISEGSCNTTDWTGINYFLKHKTVLLYFF